MTSFDQPPPAYDAAPAQDEPLRSTSDDKTKPTDTNEPSAESSTAATHQGYGIKLGSNSFLGISLPPNSNGYGIRIGGVLLGVSTTSPEDAATTK